MIWQPKQTPRIFWPRCTAAVSSARSRTIHGSSPKESEALPVTTMPWTCGPKTQCHYLRCWYGPRSHLALVLHVRDRKIVHHLVGFQAVFFGPMIVDNEVGVPLLTDCVFSQQGLEHYTEVPISAKAGHMSRVAAMIDIAKARNT